MDHFCEGREVQTKVRVKGVGPELDKGKKHWTVVSVDQYDNKTRIPKISKMTYGK